METLKFKTNIKCGGCIATVTPALNSLAGIQKWEVDTTIPDKILTIQADDKVTIASIINALKDKGYTATAI